MVVHCKSGARSAKAIALLREAGFTRLKNLTGGILAWTKDVDPSLPTLLSRAFAGSPRTRPLQRRAPCDIFHVPRASRCRPGSGRRSDAPAGARPAGTLDEPTAMIEGTR